MDKSFDAENNSFSPALLQAVHTAIEIENPMEAEKFLNNYRLDFLETLRPMDSFSEDFIYYYYLKLKLLNRIKQFNVEQGQITYKNIYNSIINGKKTEAM